MDVTGIDLTVSRIAAAIGEPARVRILHALLDGHARTSTELAIVAEVSPSTASIHLHRLQEADLIQVFKQGKHRYHSLAGSEVAKALEALNVIAGRPPAKFVPSTPSRLLLARTCYDHLAGKLGVLLHNRFRQMRWLATDSNGGKAYKATPEGARLLKSLGIDIEAMANLRRKFAYPCLDWSERQPHIGGALAAALLTFFMRRRWLASELDGRALYVTRAGKLQMEKVFGLTI